MSYTPIRLPIIEHDLNQKLVAVLREAFPPITGRPLQAPIETDLIGLHATATQDSHDVSLGSWRFLSRAGSERGIYRHEPVSVVGNITTPGDPAHRAMAAFARIINMSHRSLAKVSGHLWMESNPDRGYDMREVFFFPDLVLICHSVHDQTDELIEDVLANHAILVPEGLSAHRKLALQPTLELVARILTATLSGKNASTHVFDPPRFG